MTENIVHTEQEELTTRDIFEKIAQLQKQMAESSFHSLHRLGEAISSIGEDEENEHKADHVDQICQVFIQRELTWQKMLALYEKMYDDMNMQEIQKVGIIKSAFSEQVESIIKSDLNKEDKYAAIGDVTHQITELTDKLLFPGTINKAKDRIVAEMAYIIKSPDTDAVAKAEAGDVLRSYMEWQTNDK